MPIFMDLHSGIGDLTATALAEAHRKDVQVQERFGCKALTYWIDEPRSCVFCLIEAPDSDAVRKMHALAHGFIPSTIIPVSTDLVQSFLGRIQDPETYTISDNSDLKVFSDPAFRVIMIASVIDEQLLALKIGNEKAADLLSTQSESIREQIHKHDGSEVELDLDCFVVSFVSATKAVQCALGIQKAIHIAAELLDLRLGLHAGQPVTSSGSMFESTIRLANFLCDIGTNSQLLMSSTVKQLYKEDTRLGIPRQAYIKSLTIAEEHFLEALVETLAAEWQNAEFDMPAFCSAMSMSKPQLYRKSKSITGMSPNEILREYRLRQSRSLLKKGDRNITQTTFDAGFGSPSYFAKCFQDRFGIPPLAYLKAVAGA